MLFDDEVRTSGEDYRLVVDYDRVIRKHGQKFGVQVDHWTPQAEGKGHDGWHAEDRKQWLHYLGNLALMPGVVNQRSSNKAPKDKAKHYTKSNIVKFCSTDDLVELTLAQGGGWTPEACATRHNKIVLAINRRLDLLTDRQAERSMEDELPPSEPRPKKRKPE